MENIKGLFYDVGGTVFDWKNTAREKIQKIADAKAHPIDGEAFAYDWRGEMFKVHTQVRHGNLPWMNADSMHLRALENLTNKYPLLSTIDRVSLVKSTWHHLKVFEGAPAAISRLRNKYTVVVLTILSWESIVSSSKAAEVNWDDILSCEFLGYYKPSLSGTLLLIPAALVEGLPQAFVRIDLNVAVLILFLGIFGGALGYFLWTFALTFLTPTQVAVYVNVNPMVAIILGAVLLGEKLTGVFVVGFMTVVVGVMFVNWPRRIESK